MTQDSVMLSLKELSALEERRVFEEEERIRLEQLAKRQAAAQVAENARLAAERDAAERAAAKDARERAEREQQARVAAIREAELLKAKLGAEAERIAKEHARQAAEAVAAAEAAGRAAQTKASSRANRWLVGIAAATTLIAGLAIAVGVRASQKADRMDLSLSVLSATLAEERATSARLGADLAKLQGENRELLRAVEEAQSAVSAARLASNTGDRAPAPAGGVRFEPKNKPITSVGVGVNSGTCDPLDPLCGFEK